MKLLFLKNVPVKGWRGSVVYRDFSFDLCEYCGSQITDRRRTRCCSTECNDRYWARVRREEEATPGVRPRYFWTSIKHEVLERDRYACQRCGRVHCDLRSYSETIEVHHIVPVSEGGTSEPANLICLCTRCHAEVHADLRLAKKKQSRLGDFRRSPGVIA